MSVSRLSLLASTNTYTNKHFRDIVQVISEITPDLAAQFSNASMWLDRINTLKNSGKQLIELLVEALHTYYLVCDRWNDNQRGIYWHLVKEIIKQLPKEDMDLIDEVDREVRRMDLMSNFDANCGGPGTPLPKNAVRAALDTYEEKLAAEKVKLSR